MKPSLGKLSKIIFNTLKHKKTLITNHEAYNKYLVMVCGKMAMKYGKVWKYDLEVVEKYDRKAGIFKAQHRLYCAWPSHQQLPRVYDMFQFWRYNYMI